MVVILVMGEHTIEYLCIVHIFNCIISLDEDNILLQWIIWGDQL